jgi:oxygen-dependent protoporphyrinogen oxidase
MKSVVIIGGGVAGLTTAYRLKQWGGNAVEYRVVESLPRLGGKITSAYQDGFLIEGGPDSFNTQKTAALELCRCLGLEGQLLGLKSASPKAHVWSKGRLRPMPDAMSLVPTRIVPFLKSSLVSWPGKLRMGMDLFIPPHRDDAGDESLAAFVRRRLGQEALHRIADPLMAGIHAADPERLSLQSTFPRFQELEREYGGLVRAMWAQRNKNSATAATKMPVSPLVTLKGGLQEIIDALVSKLDAKAVRVNRRVLGFRRTLDGYEIFLEGESAMRADAIVFATPAHVTADLVQNIDPRLASKLREIRYVSTATVSLGFRRSDLPGTLEGSGFLVPYRERRSIMGCTWCSNKFEGRAPNDYILMRTFIGGARAEHLAEQDDDSLLELARQELLATMGIQAMPVVKKVYRWQKANPQYEIGHQARITEIEQLISQHQGLYLAGAGYRGISIPDCIQSGNRAAQALLQGRIDQDSIATTAGDFRWRRIQ